MKNQKLILKFQFRASQQLMTQQAKHQTPMVKQLHYRSYVNYICIYIYIYNERKGKYILFMNIIVLIICFLPAVGQEVGEPSTAGRRGRQSNAEAVTSESKQESQLFPYCMCIAFME